MIFSFYLTFLLLIPLCFCSYDFSGIVVSSAQILNDKSVIKWAKRDKFSLLEGRHERFKIKGKEDAELFFSFFILSQLKINNPDTFKEDLDTMEAKYRHIKPLND